MALESSIESNVNTYAVKLGILARKLNFGEGWPDRMYLYRGNILFIEFKAPGEKPTKLQLYMHDVLRKQGFRVEVVDSVTEGKKLIKDWHDRTDQHMATIRRNYDQD